MYYIIKDYYGLIIFEIQIVRGDETVVCSLLGCMNRDDGSGTFHRNYGKHIQNYTEVSPKDHTRYYCPIILKFGARALGKTNTDKNFTSEEQ